MLKSAIFVIDDFRFQIDYQAGSNGNDVELTAIGKVVTGTSRADDPLDGTIGADIIKGLAGNDVIDAGAGIDLITGGTGKDTMTGGADADIFDFNDLFKGGNESTKGANRDVI